MSLRKAVESLADKLEQDWSEAIDLAQQDQIVQSHVDALRLCILVSEGQADGPAEVMPKLAPNVQAALERDRVQRRQRPLRPLEEELSDTMVVVVADGPDEGTSLVIDARTPESAKISLLGH